MTGGIGVGAGPKAGKITMPPLRMQGLQGSAELEGRHDRAPGRVQGYENGAAASESEEAEYSDAFDENATTGQSSRECTQEQDVFDKMLDAARHRQPPGENDPGPPRAESCSRESLRSGRSTSSNLSARQNRARVAVLPPQGNGRDVSQPVADVSYARGSSAPALGARPNYPMEDGCSDQSEGMPPDDRVHEEEEEPQGEVMTLSYPSYSWHETLSRFPSLLRLYPLAECNEGAMEDELFPSAGEGGAGAEEDRAAGADACAEAAAPELQTAAAEPGVGRGAAEAPVAQGQRTAELRVEGAAGASTPPPCTPVRVGVGRAEATPHSAPSRGGSRCGQAAGGSRAGSRAGWGPCASGSLASADLAAAWAEVDQVRRDLAQREREVAQRELAVRRAEARNQAAARELGELRRRLDDYGEELENGVAALTAQQSALRDERRQTLELQARARRMCAAAVRDDVVASKFREWDRRSWTPAPVAGGN